MTTKTSRLAGAAAGAFLAAGMAVPAHGRPARHPPTRSTEAAISRQAAEIEQLKAQVASLSARLLAQERQAEARQAQAAAQQVAAPRAAEIQTIPGAVKAQSASAPAKAGNTQISGRM